MQSLRKKADTVSTEAAPTTTEPVARPPSITETVANIQAARESVRPPRRMRHICICGHPDCPTGPMVAIYEDGSVVPAADITAAPSYVAGNSIGVAGRESFLTVIAAEFRF